MKKVRKTILSMACALCVLSILACNPTVTAGESNGNEQNQSSATVVKMSELRAYLESLEPNITHLIHHMRFVYHYLKLLMIVIYVGLTVINTFPSLS